MIGRLSGRIVEDSAEGNVVIDVAGVGYEVTVPLGALGRASRDESGIVTLYVHTHVREDLFALYGFPSRDDRAAFRELIGVSNVGPKIAMALLGSLSAGELASVISRGEVARLVAVPGIGKKTAERLILELKGKLQATPVAPAKGAAPVPAAPEGQAELLASALTRMGFKPAEAERAVAALGARVKTEPLGDLVRDALAVLSKK